MDGKGRTEDGGRGLELEVCAGAMGWNLVSLERELGLGPDQEERQDQAQYRTQPTTARSIINLWRKFPQKNLWRKFFHGVSRTFARFFLYYYRLYYGIFKHCTGLSTSIFCVFSIVRKVRDVWVVVHQQSKQPPHVRKQFQI